MDTLSLVRYSLIKKKTKNNASLPLFYVLMQLVNCQNDRTVWKLLLNLTLRVINFRILITWATSRRLNILHRQTFLAIFLFQRTTHVHRQWLAYTSWSTKNVNYCEMLIYHSQFALTVLPEDQQESWNINLLAATVTPHFHELKPISLFKSGH